MKYAYLSNKEISNKDIPQFFNKLMIEYDPKAYVYYQRFRFKQAWQCTPIIPATKEAEVEGSQVGSQSGILKTLSK